MSPVRNCTMPQQWLGPPMTSIGDAERIHDVEREQRDVRRLEHVAAGVEHEIRRALARRCGARRPGRAAPAASSSSCRRDSALTSRATLRKSSTPLRRCVARSSLALRHGDARHAQQEARIDAVVAGLDAIARRARRHSPICAPPRCPRRPQDIDDAADHLRAARR